MGPGCTALSDGLGSVCGACPKQEQETPAGSDHPASPTRFPAAMRSKELFKAHLVADTFLSLVKSDLMTAKNTIRRLPGSSRSKLYDTA